MLIYDFRILFLFPFTMFFSFTKCVQSIVSDLSWEVIHEQINISEMSKVDLLNYIF